MKKGDVFMVGDEKFRVVKVEEKIREDGSKIIETDSEKID